MQYKNDTDPNTSGNQPGKWAERVLTSNGAAITLPPATVPYPNSGALAVSGDYVWVRLAYDDVAKTLTTATSLDGITFTTFGAPISTTQYLTQAGGYRIGVFGKRDGATANKNVELESFTLESANCGTGADTTAPTTTHVLDPAAPNGDGGYYKSDVKVTLSATDNAGGLGRRQDRVPRAGCRELDRVQRSVQRHQRRLAHDRVPLDRQGGQHRGDQVGHVQARQDRPGHHGQARR